MLKIINECQKYVEITGFRNTWIDNADIWIKTVQPRKHERTAIQFFDANLIATWEHLYFAVLNALSAFATRKNISRSIAMETMLYASAQRQIRKAIELVGVKHGMINVAVAIIGENPALVETTFADIKKRFGKPTDESVVELSENKAECICRAFKISEEEIRATMQKGGLEQAIVGLVIERVALLSTRL
jgi:tRNA threonylcarbamoyladenosine modification (KEOPS) complex Cgi121 subunit